MAATYAAMLERKLASDPKPFGINLGLSDSIEGLAQAHQVDQRASCLELMAGDISLRETIFFRVKRRRDSIMFEKHDNGPQEVYY